MWPATLVDAKSLAGVQQDDPISIRQALQQGADRLRGVVRGRLPPQPAVAGCSVARLLRVKTLASSSALPRRSRPWTWISWGGYASLTPLRVREWSTPVSGSSQKVRNLSTDESVATMPEQSCLKHRITTGYKLRTCRRKEHGYRTGVISR